MTLPRMMALGGEATWRLDAVTGRLASVAL
jgi:hypothetical protein